MSARVLPLGPAGKQLALNVAQIRKARGLSLRGLSKVLKDAGWTLGASADVYGKAWVPVADPALANEPITTTVTRYKCPHCNRHHSSKRKAVEHIARCFRNPALRTCRTCVHHRFEENEPETGWHMPEHCEADVEPEAWPVVGCPLWEFAEGVKR